MREIVISLLAGLGFFFGGVKMVGANLKQMTSRRIRNLVGKWAENPWLAALLGAIIILITQSGSAVTFIVVSLIASGMLTVRKALPMIIWANGGGALLVLVAMLDIRLLVLLLLGIGGVCFYLDKPFRYRNAIAAVFGLALLFFGLQWIRTSAAPLSELPWFKSMLQSTNESYLLALGVGTFLSFVVQSSAAVTVVAIAMTQAGLFTVNQTIMIVYGTNLGSSLTVWFLSSGLKGTSKQLAMAQVLFNLVACALFVPLFYLEVYGGIPLMKSLVASLSGDIAKQMAYVFFIFNLFTAIFVSVFLKPYHQILERLWPPTEEENKSKVKYIHEQAIHDPETAMDLVRKEQLRLLQLIPEYLEQARLARTSPGKTFDGSATQNAFHLLAEEVQAFLNSLVDKDLAPKTSERLIRLLNSEKTITSLEENVYHFALNLSALKQTGPLGDLARSFVEALDTILLTLIDAMESSTEADLDMLASITGDRGPMMEKIREDYLNSPKTLLPEEKSALLYGTNLFERIVWMVGQLGKSARTP